MYDGQGLDNEGDIENMVEVSQNPLLSHFHVILLNHKIIDLCHYKVVA